MILRKVFFFQNDKKIEEFNILIVAVLENLKSNSLIIEIFYARSSDILSA